MRDYMKEDRRCEENDAMAALTEASDGFSDELIEWLFLILLLGCSESFNFDNNGSAPVVIDKKNETNQNKERGEN